jgi:sugar phosphate isomerase/epimerase
MPTLHVTRRQFLAAAATGLAASATSLRAAGSARWTIGCLNRPWVKWSIENALDGVKAAGYPLVGLQTTTAADVFAASDSPEYLAALRQKIAVRGLKANVVRLRTQDGQPFEKSSTEIRRQLDNARALGLTVAINTGTAKPDHYDGWYRQMAYAAACGAERGIQLVTKPHGGVVAGAAEILHALEEINHPNLSIWYDAGNVIHYTGKDPLAELEPILRHVTAFTAKDCKGQGSEVMIQLGTGQVDTLSLLRRLKQTGFTGPIMLEGCAVGATAAATTANAKANREYLEGLLARL